jgi:dinuclear metal center YbgI/SA1388 family protein
MKLKKVVAYLNDLIPINTIEDESLNGLQIANSGEVKKILFAVDTSMEAIKQAAEGEAMLFVHHGLFWGRERPITDLFYHRIKAIIDADIALYASHLPLDIHPTLGNSVQAVQSLRWPDPTDFGVYRGCAIGKKAHFSPSLPLSGLQKSIESTLQCRIQSWLFGRNEIKSAAFVSGGGIGMLEQAIEEGIDVLITGEPKHSYYWTAKEAMINVLLAGHYATETPGIRAVAKLVGTDLGIETRVLDLPTGH